MKDWKTKEEKEAERIIKMFHEIMFDSISMLDYDENKIVVCKCAIIHVNGIIEVEQRIYDLESDCSAYSELDYWKRVKTILENK